MKKVNRILFGLFISFTIIACSRVDVTLQVTASKMSLVSPATPTSQSQAMTPLAQTATPATPTAQSQAKTPLAKTATSVPPTPLPVLETINILYTSERKLDVYAPAGSGSWPVVVVLHGLGDMKEIMAPLSEAIAGRGAVVFTPNWRYGTVTSADKIAGQPEDVACAVRFARWHASEYHGNPNRLVVVGHSGGAVIGAVITLAGDDFHGDCLVNEGSALPDGFVGLDGGYDNLRGVEDIKLEEFTPERWAVISPFDYVFIDRRPSRQDIQFDIMVGTQSVLFMRNAYAFYYGLLCDGYKATLTELPGVGHAGMLEPREEILRVVMAAVQR